jgi:hypothetical protein
LKAKSFLPSEKQTLDNDRVGKRQNCPFSYFRGASEKPIAMPQFLARSSQQRKSGNLNRSQQQSITKFTTIIIELMKTPPAAIG